MNDMFTLLCQIISQLIKLYSLLFLKWIKSYHRLKEIGLLIYLLMLPLTGILQYKCTYMWNLSKPFSFVCASYVCDMCICCVCIYIVMYVQCNATPNVHNFFDALNSMHFQPNPWKKNSLCLVCEFIADPDESNWEGKFGLKKTLYNEGKCLNVDNHKGTTFV